MPILTTSVPKYRKKKVNGSKNTYAVVCINGREHALGPYNSRASKAEYDRLIGQYIASGRSAGFGRHEHEVMTLRQLVIEYGKWAKEHYVRADGTPTGTHQNMRPLMTLLLNH